MRSSQAALKKLVEIAGSQVKLSNLMGRSSKFVGVTLCKGNKITSETLALAASAVDMKLCICKNPPKDAIIIEPEVDDD